MAEKGTKRMDGNTLIDSPEREHRIRERAYFLWEADGQPEGRADEFWERARELIGLEESAGVGLLPNPMAASETVPGVMVEKASI